MGKYFTDDKLQQLEDLATDVRQSLASWDNEEILGSDAETLFGDYLREFLTILRLEE